MPPHSTNQEWLQHVITGTDKYIPSFVKFPMTDGMIPLNRLSYSPSCSIMVKKPVSVRPTKHDDGVHNVRSFVCCINSNGMVPVMPVIPTSNPTVGQKKEGCKRMSIDSPRQCTCHKPKFDKCPTSNGIVPPTEISRRLRLSE